MMNLWSTPTKTGHRWNPKMYHGTVSRGKVVPNIRTVNHWRIWENGIVHTNEIRSYMAAQNVPQPSEQWQSCA